MPYQSDPNSKRSKRRANRKNPFNGSRPVRRATSKLAARIKQYQDIISMPNVDGKGFTKPGAMQHW